MLLNVYLKNGGILSFQTMEEIESVRDKLKIFYINHKKDYELTILNWNEIKRLEVLNK